MLDCLFVIVALCRAFEFIKVQVTLLAHQTKYSMITGKVVTGSKHDLYTVTGRNDERFMNKIKMRQLVKNRLHLLMVGECQLLPHHLVTVFMGKTYYLVVHQNSLSIISIAISERASSPCAFISSTASSMSSLACA